MSQVRLVVVPPIVLWIHRLTRLTLAPADAAMKYEGMLKQNDSGIAATQPFFTGHHSLPPRPLTLTAKEAPGAELMNNWFFDAARTATSANVNHLFEDFITKGKSGHAHSRLTN